MKPTLEDGGRPGMVVATGARSRPGGIAADAPPAADPAPIFSVEVSGKGLPRALVTGEGRVAVLLGVESRTLPRHFSTPYGEVKLVTVKVLLPSELAYLLEYGVEGARSSWRGAS